MNFLEHRDIGFHYRKQVIPLVTGAVIFDLFVGDGKVRPTREDGFKAAQAASDLNFNQGNVGVGCGATVGKWALGTPMKGGFGMAVSSLGEDILVAAFVVTNSVWRCCQSKKR